MAIAQMRIAEEASRRTGGLDLSNLGLASLPEALFDLKHLRVLNLGCYQHPECNTSRNRIDAQRERFDCLTLLESLFVRGSDLTSLEPRRDFQRPIWLSHAAEATSSI
jgi:hypothetical protein